VLTKKPIGRTERVLPFPAEVALVAGKAGIDHHPVAGVEFPDLGARGLDFAGGVRCHDVGEGESHAGESTNDEEIEMIEGGHTDPDEHFVRRGQAGRWYILDAELLDVAMGGEGQRAHAGEVLKRKD
jgi:hypothetical protein